MENLSEQSKKDRLSALKKRLRTRRNILLRYTFQELNEDPRARAQTALMLADVLKGEGYIGHVTEHAIKKEPSYRNSDTFWYVVGESVNQLNHM